MQLHPIMLLYCLVPVSFGAPMYDIVLPKLNQCPYTMHILDFCKTQFNSCMDKKSFLNTCKHQFFDCTETPLPSAEKHCAAEVANIRRVLENSKAEITYMKPTPFEFPIKIKAILDEIEKDCGLKIDSVGTLYQFVSIGNHCIQKHKATLDEELLKLDKQTSMDLPIPADRFRCGWHFGYIGTVLSRYWINKSCGPYSMDFNHLCAKHYNCYLDQKEKSDCDQDYESDRKYLVYGMTSFKDSCHSLIYNKSHEIFRPTDEAYKLFETTSIKTEMRPFNGKLHKPLPISATENLNFTTIKVFELSSDGSLDMVIRNIFNWDIYRSGWAHRVIIDSSAMIFEDCRRNNQLRRCLNQLVFSISDIFKKEEEFIQVINKFNQTVSDILAPPLTKSEINGMIRFDLFVFEVLFLAQYFGFLAVIKAWKRWNLCKKHPPTPPSNVEDIPLNQHQDSPEEGIGSSSMASVAYSVADSDTVVISRQRPEPAETE